MRNIERERFILARLKTDVEVTVADLAAELALSEATVRRELTAMEERGLLRRVHGGATLEGVQDREPFYKDKEGQNTEAKLAIAAAALDLIDDGDRLYLDGGSTILQLAKLLEQRHDLTVVTNSLMAAWTLMDMDHRLILVGGEFRPLSRTLVGTLTAPLIRAVHVDKAFMGTIGVTLDEGMTTTDPNEAYTKDLIMQRADRVVLMADSSKLGRKSFACCGNLQQVDTLIAERIPPDFRQALSSAGVQFIEANQESD